jgi:hypothetical protein
MIYQKKPALQISTIWAFPCVLYMSLTLYKNNIHNIKNLLNFNLLLYVFLFCAPLISAFGTNTDLGGKILLFILPWGVLYAIVNKQLKFKTEYLGIKEIFIICTIIMTFQPLHDIYINLRHQKQVYYFNKYKPVSGMQLNKYQYEYFNRVNGILKKYNYKQDKDVMFSTTFDHMTICTFNAVPCENYQLPNHFLAEQNKRRLAKPDFILLNKYDYDTMSDSIASLKWGFPENYDKYFVGTPDPNCIWDNQRWLYCSKNKKYSPI